MEVIAIVSLTAALGALIYWLLELLPFQVALFGYRFHVMLSFIGGLIIAVGILTMLGFLR